MTGELRIEHIATERLKLDPRNPRVHSDRQVKQKSIEAMRTVQVQDVVREKDIEVANQDKAIEGVFE